MANPQIENGHVKIANEIWDAISRIRISGEEWQVLSVIIRKTYGWNKKEDKISLSQFVLATGLKKPNVVRARQKLLSKKITIIKKDNTGNLIYRFNKNFDEWQPLSKKITVIKNDNKSLSKKIPTKDTTKDKRIYKPENEKKSPQTPYQNMVDAYHEILPGLPAVRKLTEKRKAQAKKIWHDDEMQDMDKWRSYLEYIRGSKFLMGQNNNGRNWQADFEWITNYNNFAKIIEGKYHK